MDVDGNNKNNEMAADDPIVHWERFQDSGRKKMKLMQDEKEKLETEKEKLQKELDTMHSLVATAANVSDDDIIEINAGGKIIAVLRSTLTVVPDTVFAYMFSGRWEGSLKRDSNGRIFLNNDPELIKIIINYLRTKAIEDPSSNKVIVCPKIPEGKEQAFEVLLNYFGLTDFFFPPSVSYSLDINNIDVVKSNGSGIDVTKSENTIHFMKSRNDGHHEIVVCKPTLDSSGEGSFWKVTIDTLPSAYVFLGIIGNLDVSNSEISYSDPTCYGWTSNAYQGGTPKTGESSHIAFTQGECLHFHLKANKITMFRVQKDQKLTIDVPTTEHAYYIHFNMYFKGTKLMLEPLDEEERVRFLLKLNETL